MKDAVSGNIAPHYFGIPDEIKGRDRQTDVEADAQH